jgi:hypothetical protein
MRVALISSALVAMTLAAHAAPDDDVRKACIINAAQKLPIIAGLQIIKAVAFPDTKNSTPEAKFWQVDIDFAAAGQNVTWSFNCVLLPDGNVRALRTK